MAKREVNMYKSILVKDTTKEEREQIVAESLGNIEGGCDGCAPGILKMYDPYINGEMELRECTMNFRAHYVSGEEVPTKSSCGYMN